MPFLRERFQNFAEFSHASIDEILGPKRNLVKEWKATGIIQVAELKSMLPPADQVQEAARGAARDAKPSPVAKAEIDFLKEALELERRTSAFYQDLVTKLEPEHRALFERFLEIEEGHVTIVQAEIDAVAGHGHWFDFMEFRLES